MNEKIAQIEKKFNTRSLRERVLIFAALVAIVYMGWNAALYNYFLATDEEIAKNMQQIKSQINRLEGQIDTISEVVGRNPTAVLIERVTLLKKENEALNQKLRDSIKNMVSPQEMDEMIHDIISKTQNLTVVSIESLPAQPLFAAKELKLNEGKAGSFQVFDHGIRIELMGGYFETLQFLKALEKQKMNVIWEELSYEVKKYPKASVVIVLRTLSLEEGSIGV